MEKQNESGDGKEIFRLVPEYPAFFIFLAGMLIINISIWIKDLPGKLPVGIVSLVLLLSVAYVMVEIRFYKDRFLLRRPLLPWMKKTIAAEELDSIRVVNNTFTKFQTRIDVIFRMGIRPKRKSQRMWKKIDNYPWEPKAIYALLKENYGAKVELKN